MIRARYLCASLLAPSLAVAGGPYEYARVVSSQPLYDTVTYRVPLEQCREERVAYREPARGSATVPVLGAIIGGALGHAVGHHKRNKQVGAAVGAVLGGSIGADVARRQRGYGDSVRYTTEEVCSVVHEERAEERLTGYRVTYRYGGETYTTHMDHDPGERLRVRVQVTPIG